MSFCLYQSDAAKRICKYQCGYCEGYQAGEFQPIYPPPAIPTKVGWMPASDEQPFPSAYWFVCNRYLLWSFFECWEGMIIERWNGAQE